MEPQYVQAYAEVETLPGEIHLRISLVEPCEEGDHSHVTQQLILPLTPEMAARLGAELVFGSGLLDGFA